MPFELAHTQSGSGEVLLLLHGNGESKEYFKNQIDAFSKHFLTVAVDTRGHGQTERGTAPFTLSQFADDLYAFTLEKGFSKVNILGFSDGANIAMYFALKHPQQLDRLVLNGGNINPGGVKRRFQIPIEASYAALGLFSALNPKFKQKRELLSLMVNEPQITPEELSKITAPTLVIAGTDDMIKTSHTRLIAKSLKNSRLVFLDGDHFIAEKRSNEFNKAVLDFLGRNERGK